MHHLYKMQPHHIQQYLQHKVHRDPSKEISHRSHGEVTQPTWKEHQLSVNTVYYQETHESLLHQKQLSKLYSQ